MNLETIFDQLELGELAQISLTERVNGELPASSKKSLATHINMALTALHKRFLLKEEAVTIALQPGQYAYVLSSRFAESNTRSDVDVKYILDLDDPFKDTVLSIHAVTDDLGDDLLLDHPTRIESLKRTSYRTIVLPAKSDRFKHPLDYSETMTVIYQANHRQLTDMDLVYPANMIDIDLPETHLEPLVYYVASRVMNPIGLNEEFHAGNNYAAKYEESCRQLEDQGFGMSAPGQDHQFSRGGWV